MWKLQDRLEKRLTELVTQRKDTETQLSQLLKQGESESTLAEDIENAQQKIEEAQQKVDEKMIASNEALENMEKTESEYNILRLAFDTQT